MRHPSPTHVTKEQLVYAIEKNVECYVFNLFTNQVFNYAFYFDLMKDFEPTVSIPKRYQQGRIRDREYFFFNDELMYDAQLGPLAFDKEEMSSIFSNGKFISNSDNQNFSKRIMINNSWVSKYAEKKFLCVFRPDYSMLEDNIKFLYGFHINNLRLTKNDLSKWF